MTSHSIERIPPLVKLCVPRKRHRCRICGDVIEKGEPCERWTGVEQGEGWWTCHAHPDCLDLTVTDNWKYEDWEYAPWESGAERPAEKRKCFMCHKEATAWIALQTRPRYVCSIPCYHNYCAAVDMT